MATEIIGLLKKLPAEDFNRIHELMSSGVHSLTLQVVKLMKEDTST